MYFPEALRDVPEFYRFVPLSSPRLLLFFHPLLFLRVLLRLLANLLYQPPPTPPSCIDAALLPFVAR